MLSVNYFKNSSLSQKFRRSPLWTRQAWPPKFLCRPLPCWTRTSSRRTSWERPNRETVNSRLDIKSSIWLHSNWISGVHQFPFCRFSQRPFHPFCARQWRRRQRSYWGVCVCGSFDYSHWERIYYTWVWYHFEISLLHQNLIHSVFELDFNKRKLSGEFCSIFERGK